MSAWTFIGVTEGRSSCEECGHPIRWLFTIRNSEGVTKQVGSECVVHLLAERAWDAASLNRRLNRAKAQWKQQKPAAKDGETRTEYIARRLTEMSNALAAHKASLGYRPAKPGDYSGFAAFCAELDRTYSANIFDYNRPIWEVRKV